MVGLLIRWAKKGPEMFPSPGTMGCGFFVFIELLNAAKVSCCNLVVQVVKFDAHKKTSNKKATWVMD